MVKRFKVDSPHGVASFVHALRDLDTAPTFELVAELLHLYYGIDKDAAAERIFAAVREGEADLYPSSDGWIIVQAVRS